MRSIRMLAPTHTLSHNLTHILLLHTSRSACYDAEATIPKNFWRAELLHLHFVDACYHSHAAGEDPRWRLVLQAMICSHSQRDMHAHVAVGHPG